MPNRMALMLAGGTESGGGTVVLPPDTVEDTSPGITVRLPAGSTATKVYKNGKTYTVATDRWSASDNPGTSCMTKMTSLRFIFVRGFSADVSHWDTSNVTSMASLFGGLSLNVDLTHWDTSSVTDMSGMFENGSMNPNITGWDVSNVTDMMFMFFDAVGFNQDISGWNVSNVNEMDFMFYGAKVFNQDLSGWCVTNHSEKPFNFDSGTTAWVKAGRQPVWGTCP